MLAGDNGGPSVTGETMGPVTAPPPTEGGIPPEMSGAVEAERPSFGGVNNPALYASATSR